jgi:hypothetical protein
LRAIDDHRGTERADDPEELLAPSEPPCIAITDDGRG